MRRILVVGVLLMSSCSDSEACVARYRVAFGDASVLAQECPIQGSRLLQALDHPEINPDRSGSTARAARADVTIDVVNETDHDCNVRALELRERLAAMCR